MRLALAHARTETLQLARYPAYAIPTLALPALLLLFLFAGLGAVGFVDDYIKVVKQRSLGLRSKAKFTGQTLIDFDGGDKLGGRAPLAPVRALLMDASGRMTVHNELENVQPVSEFNAIIEADKAAARQRAGQLVERIVASDIFT